MDFINNHPSKHSSWCTRLEVVLKTSFVFVFRRRLQDVLILSWSYVFKTSSSCLQDVLRKRLQDIFKTSWRRFEDVFKTSSRHLQDVLRRLEDVLKRFPRDIFKSFSRRIIKFNCSCQKVFTRSSRRIQHVFETYCEEKYLQK